MKEQPKKLKKRTKQNPNTLEQYGCACFCGPGGFPWSAARLSAHDNQWVS